MPKSIVFCADGTWNGPGQVEGHEALGNATNVFKLFVNLDGALSQADLALADEQEKAAPDGSQIAKYIHGVGDSGNTLVRLLGGAVGAGILTRILRGYTFISRNYQPGDRIYIAGFSRGAYTARALAGMIAGAGVMDATKADLTDKSNAYRLAAAVWYKYRKKTAPRKGLLERLNSVIDELPGFFSNTKPPPMLADVPIEAVAVWDTVGSLGIPVYMGENFPLDLFQFADTKLSPKVNHGVHFVAVDEQREDFTPTLWQGDAERIEQTLFPGAHSDVGGGYPVTNAESGLSDWSLVDMQQRLTALGVRFADPPPLATAASAIGPAHEPWRDPPFNHLNTCPRDNLKGLPTSQSFKDRKAGGNVRPDPRADPSAYNPANV